MTLSIDGLKYLSHNASRPASWDKLAWDEDVANDTFYSYGQAFDFEDTGGQGTGGTHEVVYVRGPGAMAIVVDGRAVTTAEIDERFHQADSDNVDEVEEQCAQWRDIIDRAQDGVYGAEGPMMSWYWAIEDDADDFDENKLAEMAALIKDLPLCAIWLDGTLGVALTGGGMDLSWHIAEAFIRLGWFPPSSLTLPNFDYRDDEPAIREAIVRAVHTSKSVAAAQLMREAKDVMRLLPAQATT
jgi:hypothetical protein